jgi:DNA gyrase subunit A
VKELNQVIKDSFIQYSGAVIQSRALVDVRDCLKPSARQIFYSMLTRKLTSDKPHKKTANAVGMAMADFYIHGDSSCEGIIMRAGQPFSMRYPLVDVKGNYGSLIESGNYAAMRYTESRLSKMCVNMFSDIDKDTINEWRDNYDNTKQYPAVLPTKGFYNIVNGTQGISVGMASSVPQYNLKEVNNALITLLTNPACDFDEIYCAPDFATGAVLFNESEVKQSMATGTGFACKLRSVVDYDSKERCFIVTEIPYGVYTNTICKQLEEIIEGEKNPGIDRFNDLTGKTPLLKIYLARGANPDRVLKFLYKNTSLQSYYGINFTMLEDGRFPKVFGWKELLQAHIDHEKVVYRRGFEYDLIKIQKRLHIIDGLLKAYDVIDEVIRTIKQAADTKSANAALRELLNIDEVQAKAILDLKLSRLSKLDINKLTKEQYDLTVQADRLVDIINDENLFNQELIKGWKEVAEKFGDERRTKILDLVGDEEEPVEIKSLLVSFTNKNNLLVSESSSLYTQRRGGVGSKLKLEKGEYVIDSTTCQNTDTLLLFTQKGNVFSTVAGALATNEKTPVESIISIEESDQLCAMTPFTKNCDKKYIIFITKKGMLKKSLFSEYNIKKNKTGLKAISLENDEIVSVHFLNEEPLGILTKKGQFLICSTAEVRAIGRVAKGVKGIKLNEDDEVAVSHPIPKDTTEIISISKQGLSKRTSISEFAVQGRGTKGGKLQKIDSGDELVDFLPLTNEKTIIIAATSSQIKLKVEEVRLLSKNTLGTKSIKINQNDSVLKILL